MTLNLPPGVAINAPILPGFEAILTEPALALVAKLHRAFEPRRKELLAARAALAKRIDAGERPDFLAETKSIRDGDWKIAPVPPALHCRRVEITGPVISTRRHCNAGGIGAIVQSRARMSAVSARKSGRSPASRRLARSRRTARSCWRRGSKSRCRMATSSSAGRVRIVSKPGRIGALICTPAGRSSVVMAKVFRKGRKRARRSAAFRCASAARRARRAAARSG